MPALACLTRVCSYHEPPVVRDSVESHANMDAGETTVSIEWQSQQCSIRKDVCPYHGHAEIIGAAMDPRRIARWQFHCRTNAISRCTMWPLVMALESVIRAVVRRPTLSDG